MDIALIICAAVIVVLFIIYNILIAPTSNKNIEKYATVKFAHRGLHDASRAENSMSAFTAAVEAGYGIELDIRLSGDGTLVVFHDDTLDRVCGREGRVDAFVADELAEMKLSGTNDGIPSFREVLELVDGRVPLLVEIKEDAGKYDVSTAAAEMLKNYHGDYIVESFNPLSLRNFKKKLPNVPRGILSQKYMREEKYRTPLHLLLQLLFFNRLCSPSFVAYNHIDYKSSSLKNARKLGAVTFAWTVRSPEEEAAAKAHGFDSVIFENYLA